MVRYKLIVSNTGICKTPIIVKPAPKRVIAIGDIHGDMDLMLNCLKIAGLIEESTHGTPLVYLDGSKKHYKWTGRDTVAVQVGDQVDRCRPYFNIFDSKHAQCNDPYTTFEDESSDEKILRFLTALHNEATKHGGAVYSLIGNHELMNAMGNMSYVSYLGLKEYTPDKTVVDDKGRVTYFERGSKMSHFVACTRSAVIVVGSYMYVHGGFLSTILNGYEEKEHTQILHDLDRIVKLWLLDKKQNDKDIANLVTGINSPFWVRGLGNLPANLSKDHANCQDINSVIDYFKINGMVIGHTPQLNTGINSTCGNSLFRVDVASSKAFTNAFKYQNANEKISSKINRVRVPQVLEIINDTEFYIINEHCRTPLN
jgi:ribosomal protein L31